MNLLFDAEVSLNLTTKPRHLWLEVTDKCNSKCTTCFAWRKIPTQNHDLLTLAELRRCLRDPLMSHIKSVLNSGGEATLVNLEDYLTVEHEALPNAELQISSNALLPTRLSQVVKHAMNIGVKHLDVGLSIDGVGEDHDVVRGVKGNFVRLEISIEILKMFQILYPNRIFLSMGSTLTDSTAKNAQALYDYSRKVNVPFMWHWFNSSTFYENQAKSLLATKKGVTNVIMNHPAKNLYMDLWRKSFETGNIPKFKCQALRNFLVVKCNGDVVPCLSRWKEVIGNLKKESIADIWHSNKMKEEREQISNCQGCLNVWGIDWSHERFFPYIKKIVKSEVNKIGNKF